VHEGKDGKTSLPKLLQAFHLSTQDNSAQVHSYIGWHKPQGDGDHCLPTAAKQLPSQFDSNR